MRGCALTWPFCFGLRLGWATARTPNPDPDQAVGRTYLLRDNAFISSRGFGAVCDRLRRAGLWDEDLRCVGDRWVRRRLFAEPQAGRLRGPRILVGHSCGGRYALSTAQELARWHIPVDLLVCLDVAIPFAVPANVRQAVHLYRSRRRIYPARPLRAAPGSAARVVNLDLDAPGSPSPPRGLHHLKFAPLLIPLVRLRKPLIPLIIGLDLVTYITFPVAYDWSNAEVRFVVMGVLIYLRALFLIALALVLLRLPVRRCRRSKP